LKFLPDGSKGIFTFLIFIRLPLLFTFAFSGVRIAALHIGVNADSDWCPRNSPSHLPSFTENRSLNLYRFVIGLRCSLRDKYFMNLLRPAVSGVANNL